MEYVTIYRVENDEGTGPYARRYELCGRGPDGDALYRVLESHSHCPQHPAPYGQGEPWRVRRGHGHVFGFESLPALVRWFEDAIRLPAGLFGFFVVNAYRVPRSRVMFGASGSSGQVSFERGNARPRPVPEAEVRALL